MDGNFGTAISAARRLAALILLLLAGTFATAAKADPADINAASRGVVRVLIVGEDGDQLYPVSHGTGFAVTGETIVTNAHVVEDLRRDPSLALVIVPPEGGPSVFGKLVSVNERNDLALVQTTARMNLPPLTVSTNSNTESGEVTSVGYPMNVDRAQGLDSNDIFVAQPPVTSTGFLSGRRPSRDFDTILHTAPIARGNSGGPLLDNCGRVVGVNSFGADSEGADAEFYFAVSTRELLPFLRGNDITPQVNGLPCRSLAELDAAEQQRAQRDMLAARQEEATRAAQQAAVEEKARRSAELSVLAERENRMMLAIVLVAASLVAGFIAWQNRAEDVRKTRIAATSIAGIALLGALIAWISRPSYEEIDERAEEATNGSGNVPDSQSTLSGVVPSPGTGEMVCVIQMDRSRITTGETSDVALNWSEDGCVNKRTQYGLLDGRWQRVLVPDNESVVSVASYNPQDREYRVDRYLLGRNAMEVAREARAEYTPPQCGGENASSSLGVMQGKVLALLPSSPNERLVYKCSTVPGGTRAD